MQHAGWGIYNFVEQIAECSVLETKHHR